MTAFPQPPLSSASRTQQKASTLKEFSLRQGPPLNAISVFVVLCCVLLTFSNLNRDIEQPKHRLFDFTRLHKQSPHSWQNNIYLILYYVKW
jgi:hypothetical protein